MPYLRNATQTTAQGSLELPAKSETKSKQKAEHGDPRFAWLMITLAYMALLRLLGAILIKDLNAEREFGNTLNLIITGLVSASAWRFFSRKP